MHSPFRGLEKTAVVARAHGGLQLCLQVGLLLRRQQHSLWEFVRLQGVWVWMRACMLVAFKVKTWKQRVRVLKCK